MEKKRQLINGMLMITIANILGKALGFIKNILFSYYYGADIMTDAFLLAESIPLVLLGIFTSAADSAVIPQYNRILRNKGREEADKNFSNILNIILLGAIFISFMILIFSDLFVDIFAPGFTVPTKTYAEQFLKWFSFIGVFHIVYCFCSAYSAVYSKFLVRTLSTLVPNIIILLVLIMYHDNKMIGLTIAYVTTYILSAWIPCYYIYRDGYQHKLIWSIQSLEAKKFIRNFLPIIGVALLTEIQLYVDKFLASGVQGGISYLNYASKLTGIFDTLLVSGISFMIIPVLSDYDRSKNTGKISEISCKILKYLFFILLAISCIFMVYSREIIEIIYGRGRFNQEAVISVSQILGIYSINIVLIPIQTILIRIFHAMEDTRLPFKINCVTVTLNVIFSVIFFQYMGLAGVAAGTVISFTIGSVLLAVILAKRIGWNRDELGLRHICVSFGAFLLAVLIMYGFRKTIGNLMCMIVAGSVGGLISYMIVCVVFLKKERRELLHYARKISTRKNL